MITKNAICRIFVKELDKISTYNTDIIVPIIDMLQKLTDDKFWTKPASATGVHHPKTSNIVGGNLIHTKQAFWIADSIMNITPIPDEDKCAVLCAVLLHDINKFNQSLYSHGSYAAEAIISYAIEHDCYDKLMYNIQMGVRFHMGQWGMENIDANLWQTSTGRIANIVHMADYLSSRPFLEYNEGEI